jgi:rubrerythrin
MNRLKGLLHEDMVTDEKLSSTLNIDTALFDKIIQSGDIPVQATPLNILEIALEREKSTLENYIMLLTISDLNKEIIAVFELLKGMEEQHVKDIWERIEQIRSSQ